MTDFEKMIIPFLNDKFIKKQDFTSACGFVGLYTEDIDHPTVSKNIYLVYDDTIQNEYTKSRAIRFRLIPEINKTYVKYINNKPYYIYSFWAKGDLKKMREGDIYLDIEKKKKILQFWGNLDSIYDTLLMNNSFGYDSNLVIPAKDCSNQYDNCSFTVTKKGDDFVRSYHPYLFFLMSSMVHN